MSTQLIKSNYLYFVLFLINCETFSIFRADILPVKSGFDFAVFYWAKHGTGKSFPYYGTPGLGEGFVRGKSDFTQTVGDIFEAFSVQHGENLMIFISLCEFC